MIQIWMVRAVVGREVRNKSDDIDVIEMRVFKVFRVTG
jgi:hypothetical protein